MLESHKQTLCSSRPASSNLDQVAEQTLSELKRHGAEKSQVTVKRSEIHEVNVEAGKLSLLRTTFDQGLEVQAIAGQKQAVQTGNQLDGESIDTLARSVLTAASGGVVDEAFDVADKQEFGRFTSGPEAGDIGKLTDRTEELLAHAREKHPKVIFEQVVVQFVKSAKTVMNSKGVHFQTEQTHYSFMLMFTAKNGKKTSSFNTVSLSSTDLNNPIASLGGADEILRQISEQTETVSLPGKFEGDVIYTPHGFEEFLGSVCGSLSLESLLTGQSVFQNKLSQRIAPESFNLHLNPVAREFAAPSFVTSDGYVSRNVPLIKDGVLQTFLLNQYGARKMGFARTGADPGHFSMAAGDASFAEMVRSVKKGILLCRFAGGRPAANGDISGVAKNSYYIEDGEIRYPVSEVMVAGNIPQMLMSVSQISREKLNSGFSSMPWVRLGGMTVSGK